MYGPAQGSVLQLSRLIINLCTATRVAPRTIMRDGSEKNLGELAGAYSCVDTAVAWRRRCEGFRCHVHAVVTVYLWAPALTPGRFSPHLDATSSRRDMHTLHRRDVVIIGSSHGLLILRVHLIMRAPPSCCAVKLMKPCGGHDLALTAIAHA